MILETLRQAYPDLTRSQKQLADYIASSYREAAFLNASDLAAALGLNEATVIRFAQRLGYEGYPELVDAVRALVQQELRPGTSAPQGDAFFEQYSAVLNGAQRYAGLMPVGSVGPVLEGLAAAGCVTVLGQGLGYPVALLFASLLSAAGKRTVCPLPDPSSYASAFAECDAQAAVVGIETGDGPDDIVASTLRMASRAGIATIALSSSPVSGCAQAAGLALTWPPSDGLPLPSITTAVAVAEALAQVLARRDPSAARKRQQRVARAAGSILGLEEE